MSYAFVRRVREDAPRAVNGLYGWYRLGAPDEPGDSAAPPEGYRLLRLGDLGKVFGRDLDAKIWIDAEAAASGPLPNASGEFVRIEDEAGNGYLLYHVLQVRGYTLYPPLNKDSMAGIFPEGAASLMAADFSGYHLAWCDSRDWNTWLYVRHIGEGEDTDNLSVLLEGNCGAEDGNLRYTLYSNGAMVISGSGAMADYTRSTACTGTTVNCPWYANRALITSLQVTEGVTHIGANAFYDAANLQSVSMPEGISIGADAFSGTPYLNQGGTA